MYMCHKQWNVFWTAVLCSLRMVPYIHLNTMAESNLNLPPLAFPAFRVIGGFLAATVIQLVLQRRIVTPTSG